MNRLGYQFVCMTLSWNMGGCGASLSASYGFGAPRAQIKGNPLARQIERVHKSGGPKSALAFAKQKTLVAMFPSSSNLKHRKVCIRPGILTTDGDVKRPIVIPSSGDARSFRHGRVRFVGGRASLNEESNLRYGHAICQSLGYESAHSIKTNPLSNSYTAGRWSCGSGGNTFTQIGQAGAAKGGSELDSVRLERPVSYSSRGKYSYKNMPDPVQVVVSNNKCKTSSNGRLLCPDLDLTQHQEVFKPNWDNYRVIHLLECTNASPGSLAAVRRARNAVTMAKYAPQYTRALRGYRSTKSRTYVRKLQSLLSKAPMGDQADKARDILAKAHLKEVTRSTDFARFDKTCHSLWSDATKLNNRSTKRAAAKCKKQYAKLAKFCEKYGDGAAESSKAGIWCKGWSVGLTHFEQARKQAVEEATFNKAYNEYAAKAVRYCASPQAIVAQRRAACGKWEKDRRKTRSEYNRKRASTRQLSMARARAGYRPFSYNWSSFTNHIDRLTRRIAERCTMFGIGVGMGKSAEAKWKSVYKDYLQRCNSTVGQSWINRAKALAKTDRLKAALKTFLAALPKIKESLAKASK